MELHVQSWFNLNLNDEKSRNTIKATYGVDECDPESFELSPKEFLVSVEKSGSRANPSNIAWIHLVADENIFAKVRAWILHCNAFDESKVNLSDNEVLVKVRGEYCTHTSHGVDCDCYK